MTSPLPTANLVCLRGMENPHGCSDVLLGGGFTAVSRVSVASAGRRPGATRLRAAPPRRAMGVMAGGARTLLLAACAALLVSGEVDIEAQEVVTLTEDNFAQAEEGTWMIMFWVPWCGHCRRVKPQFAEASATATTEKPVKLGTVDCTRDDSKAVCEMMQITSYPSFKYSVMGSDFMKYEGPRSTQDFVNFITRIGDPSLHVLPFTTADIDQLRARDDVNVFVFCTPEGKATEQITWIARRGLTYGRSYFGTLPSDQEFCGGRNTAYLLNDIGVTEVVPEKGDVVECLEDDLDSVRLRSVLEWVGRHKHLAVDRIDQGTFHHLARNEKPYLFMFVSAEGEWADQRPFLDVLRKVSKKDFAQQFSFGWLDGVHFGEWIADLLSLDTLPNIVIYHLDDESFFNSDEARIAVQHAVAHGGDVDGSMQSVIEDMVEGVASERYQLQFQGKAGYVLSLAQNFAPVALPYLKDLRRSAQSDVLFLGLCVVMVALMATIVMNFFQVLFARPTPVEAMPEMPKMPQPTPEQIAMYQQRAAAAATLRERKRQ